MAFANICIDIMPTEKRGEIGMVKPTGWHQAKYDPDQTMSDSPYLYNRCHLIAYELAGENANEKNLITGTRYMNVKAMLPYENMVAEHVKTNHDHVLYRSTPVFEGDNLLCTGVLLEAMSVEDNGASISFCVFCYNVQPNVDIDYATGYSTGPEFTGTDNSSLESSSSSGKSAKSNESKDLSSVDSDTADTYILNTNTRKFHYPNCSSVKQISDSNKKEFTGSRKELLDMGYEPCGNCNP